MWEESSTEAWWPQSSWPHPRIQHRRGNQGKRAASRLFSRSLGSCTCFCCHHLPSVGLALQGLFWIQKMKSGKSSNLSSKVNLLRRRLEVITISSTWKPAVSRWEERGPGMWDVATATVSMLLARTMIFQNVPCIVLIDGWPERGRRQWLREGLCAGQIKVHSISFL